jgi:hypothetical protein
VETDIGVGMSDQTVAVRHRDAAQPELVAGPEGVDIEALTGADVAAPCGEQPFGARKIVHRRHLEIILAALDQRHAHSGAFGDGGIVGQLGTGSRAMRRDDRLEVKTLRRLRPPQGAAVDCRGDAGPVAALHRVAHRQRRNGPVMRAQPGEHAVDDGSVEQRPRPVMDENKIRRRRDEALQAVAHGILTLDPACDRLQQVEPGGCRIVMRAIVGMNDDADGADRRMLDQGPQTVPQHRHPAERQILLRQRRAEAGATPGGDDEGDARGHCAS